MNDTRKTGDAAPATASGAPTAPPPIAPPPSVRSIGRVNWLGVWTLYAKEVQRFLKVYQQSVLAPVVTTLLFLAIFTLALGGAVRRVGNVPFEEFLGPGLIMMAMLQNAFANTSSSIVISKVQGNIVDVLMPPMSPGELTFCYAVSGATRGVLVGVVTSLAMSAFVPLGIHHFGFIVFHACGASLMLSLLGLIGGIWADKFDHISAVTNFVILPLSFLSGTFYSIERLPGGWNVFAHFNPFFFMIDGFRYGFIGRADGPLLLGIAVVIGINLALWWVALWMFKSGYKMKS
ncbi:MAG: ABC transporter permease [Alphaproteobacteria bacterium]